MKTFPIHRVRHKDFTIIELIMVIVIIGILAAVIAPRIISFQEDAEVVAEDATVAAIQSGINIQTSLESVE